MDKTAKDIDSMLYAIREYAYCLSKLIMECPKNSYNYLFEDYAETLHMISDRLADLCKTLGVDSND